MIDHEVQFDRAAEPRESITWPYGVALALALAVVGMYHNPGDVGVDFYNFSATTQDLELQMDSDDQVDIGSMQKKVCFAALAAIACYLAFIRVPEKPYQPNSMVWLVGLCLAWVSLSLFWSTEPSITLRELIRLYVIVFTAYGIARCFTANQMMFIVLVVCSASVFTALGSEAAAGVLRPWQSEYRLQGGMHANMVAIHAAMMGITAIGMSRIVRGKFWFWVLIVIAVSALWITKSRTATGVFLVAVAIQWSLYLGSKRTLAYWAWLATFVAVVMFVLAAGGTRLQRAFGGAASMGRSEKVGSLSGRIPLWNAITDDIVDRPLCGYGYKAFWTGERRVDIFSEIDWSPTDAHNVYFNSMLEQGIIGLLLNLTLAVCAVLVLIRAHKETNVGAYACFATLQIFAFMHGLTETGCSEARIGGLCLAAGIFLAAGYGSKPQETSQ